ncbi:CRE-SCO-1 protein [Aphelenchoides avenae]|nr:CRE-SCO-1 protein [Aphelenchus avenae]
MAARNEPTEKNPLDDLNIFKKYCAEFSTELRGFTCNKEQVAKVAKTFRVYHSEGPKTTDTSWTTP